MGFSATNDSPLYHAIAMTSIVPITSQQAALPRAPASQNPLAALKQRIALVHPLTNAPGLLIASKSFIGIPWYENKRRRAATIFSSGPILCGCPTPTVA